MSPSTVKIQSWQRTAARQSPEPGFPVTGLLGGQTV